MDSLSHAALGAAVCIAATDARTPIRRAAAWGAILGNLPDLDVFVDHGNALLDLTMHRSASHALFWLTLAAAPLAWPIARVTGEPERTARWCLAAWLALVTHALLDAMTVYGTRLALPFDDHPYAVGSVFIIDPLFTLPLAVGVVVALVRGDASGRRWNRAGLVLAALYLAWSVLAQHQVRNVVHATLAQRAETVPGSRILVTPTEFNTVLWRVVILYDDHYDEGYRSLLDSAPTMRFERFERHPALFREIETLPAAARLLQFTHGFFAMARHDGQIVMTDLRMGQHPYFAFSFALARADAAGITPEQPRNVGGRADMDVAEQLRWLARRSLARTLEPAPR